MVNLTINGKQIRVAPGTTILQACKEAGCQVPTLCYLKDINEIGACRVCIVEVKGLERLVASCNNIVEEGMEIETNSPKVREARRVNVELILSQHDCHCPTCVRNGNCSLQSLAANLGLNTMHYRREVPQETWPNDFPLIRDGAKCIKCMRCIQICDKVQSLHIWDIAKTGSRTTVGVSLNRDIHNADCALCGQCITHCPVGALKERDDSRKIFGFGGCLGAHKDKVVVASVAPAVRTAWAEEFGLSREIATPGRLVAALKSMGFDYVFDTNYAADLTIMEEGSEFLERIKHREDFKYPMFTSCCPGWVRFLKSQYPDMVKDLSTAKSPQQMQGAMVKAYFAQKMNLEPNEIVNVSIMPCVAKKAEADILAMNQGDADKDVDIVLTTRELIRRIRSMNIDVENLPELPFDSPLGNGSGAAVIFGATGGVMEAALRSCYYLATGTNPDPDSFKCVRGLEGWKEANFNVAGIQVKTAVVSGLGNTRRLVEALRRGEVNYDFVEVMACPGGCAGGGGQPIHDGEELAGVRGENLYFLDNNNQMRFSHENPDVLDTYKVLLEKPLSHKSHQLLHTDHEAWEMPLAPNVKKR